MMNRTCSLLTRVSALLTLLTIGACPGVAQQNSFDIDPAHTSVTFILADVLHTVRGTFRVKEGSLQLDRESGKLSGEIVVDATSGNTGSGMRDRKMHKEVLESERYPEISFRPDRIEGAVAAQGKSSVRVRGMFTIHGVDRQITVPADVDISADHWNAAVRFAIPYVKWGMKNPSTLFLRVGDSVEIDLLATGNVVRPSIVQPGAPTHGSTQ